MKKKQLNVPLLLLAFLCMVFGIYIVFEPYWIEDKVVNIFDPDIPESFNNTRIVFLSDIHYGPFYKRSRLRQLVQRINRLHPDLILLGGDYVQWSPKYIQPCFAELKLLKARFGVFGVLGNHDHWESAALTRQNMMDSGIHLLDNQAFWIERNGGRIKLGGVGDYFEDTQDIHPTIDDIRVKDFAILVTHNPDYAERITTDKIDLVLGGHTHGGQMTVFGWWAPLIPSNYGQKYRTGIIELSLTTVIVSNGIGTITPPIRFFARPQIIIMVLKQKQP